MIKIWTESFKSDTSQRIADQATMILKKGWFSDIEILEICGEVSREGYPQENPKQAWRNIENQNIKEPSHISMLIHEKKQKKIK